MTTPTTQVHLSQLELAILRMASRDPGTEDALHAPIEEAVANLVSIGLLADRRASSGHLPRITPLTAAGRAYLDAHAGAPR